MAQQTEKNIGNTHTYSYSCRQARSTYIYKYKKNYTHTLAHKHTETLVANSTEDRGIDSIHIWRGNRACGDSRVVGASRGSQWCAAERNSFESRFLRVKVGETQHQGFVKIFLLKKIIGFAL